MNINAVEYYLPEERLTNEQISQENPEWSIEKIASKTGIISRPIASEGMTSSDLAYCAANKLIEENNIEKEQIDFLLFCTQSPDYFLPTSACILQERLKLPKSIGALDYNLGCSGYVYGLSLAKSLIVSKMACNVLLLTGETYSKFINKKDKSCRSLFGDGASATLVSNDSGIASIKDFCFGTDGEGAENLIVKHGGFRHRPIDGYDIEGDNQEYIRNDNFLYMNGNEIFKFTSKVIPELINETIKKNELRIEDIDLFIFHQANKYMLDFIRKILNIAKERFYIYLENVGNTVSSTIPIAIKNAAGEGRIKRGNNILIAGFGVGYSYGATVLKYNN